MSPGIGVGVGLPFVHLLRRPAASILSQAIGYWLASDVNGSDDWLDQIGSADLVTAGAATDPVQINLDDPHLWLPGRSGNYAEVENSAAVALSGDWEVIVDMLPDDWDPATPEVVVDRFDSPNGWILVLGSSFLGIDYSTVFAAGEPGRFRVTHTVSGTLTRFYWAPYGSSSWTQIGGDLNLGAFAQPAVPITIGRARAAFAALRGRVYRVIVKDGIDGTIVRDVDFDDADEDTLTFAEASADGATVTVVEDWSTDSGALIVQAPCAVFGIDQFLDAAAAVSSPDPIGSTGKRTWVGWARTGTGGALRIFNQGTFNPYLTDPNGMHASIFDGGWRTQNTGASSYDGESWVICAAVLDAENNVMRAYLEGVGFSSDHALADIDLSQSGSRWVGRRPGAVPRGALRGVALFHTALSSDQIAQVGTEMRTLVEAAAAAGGQTYMGGGTYYGGGS